MEKLKAARAEIMKLGEAARNETDPVKKEARIAELRARLTEMDDRMQQEFKKRVEQAEKELPKLKAKLAEAEKNRAARIEEQVQRILAGESLRRPEGHPKRERKSPPPTL
jgi:CRISPR/Cas system CSM-associated protein Csm2 small subunit